MPEWERDPSTLCGEPVTDRDFLLRQAKESTCDECRYIAEARHA